MVDLYGRQLARVLERGIGSDTTLNPMWAQMVAKLQRLQDEGGQLTPANIAERINTRAARLPPGSGNRDLPDFLAVLARLDDPDGLTEPVYVHVAALAFLHRRKLLHAYIADMDRLGIASNQQMARTWWYWRRFQEVLAEPVDFLEIGGGSGHFAVLSLDAGMARHYVLVDLPEILLHAIATVRDLLPDYPAHLSQAPDLSGPPALWFLNPDETQVLPRRSFGAAVNFNSFSEMDREVRDAYLAQVYRTAATGCLFYNVNRRHRSMTMRNGAVFENHPLLYPYRADDEVLEWEPDEFQQATRSTRFVTPQKSFCISRICRIR